MASFIPGGKKNSKSPAFPPVKTTALDYSNFSLDNTGDSGAEEQEDSDDNDISDEASEDDEYEEGYDEESSDTAYPRTLASKRMDDIDMDTAAKLLLSVSPRIMAARPRSLSHLEPLESLAGLAALGEPEKTEVEKLRSCLDGISSASMGSLSSYNNRKGQAKGFLGLKDRETQARGKKNLKIRFKRKNKASKNNNNGKHIANDKSGRKRKRRKGDVDSTGCLKSVPEILHNSPFEKDYNQHGKIGIYTPSERAALLRRFREKRRRRVWYKKVRYGCRKNLADRRLRIKGRFVRADSKEYKEYFANLAKKAAEEKKNAEKAGKLSTIVEDVASQSGGVVSKAKLEVKTFNQTKSKATTKIMNGNETTTATLALNLRSSDNNLFMSTNPQMSPTAFNIMANKHGRPRAQSTLL